MDPEIATGVIWFVAFLFSTTVHEAMHALVAWKGGDPTAYHGGQVSLSPIPHIKRARDEIEARIAIRARI